MKIFIFVFLSFNFIYANTKFVVANYNVQNLFDLHYSGNEYQDYIPFKKSKWNKKQFNIKIKNLSKVINDLNADIIALEEIESKKALKELMKHLKYPYFTISKNKKSPVGVAILSKYPIKEQISIPIKINKKTHYRHILKVKIYIKKYPLYIYINHWPSKRHPESHRIAYAKAIKKDISWIDEPFIIIGDLNSYYNEFKSIKRRRRLNDTNGITGINHILPTIIKDKKYKMLSKKNLFQNKHKLYNLWLDLPKKNRYNYQYRKKNITLDHIILPYSMFDKKGIDYINNSFKAFKPRYLFINKNNKKVIYRWQKKYTRWSNKRYEAIHLGKGYSDHIPIYATFEVLD